MKWNKPTNGITNQPALCISVQWFSEIHSSSQKFTDQSFGMTHAIPTVMSFVLTKWPQRVAGTWNCSIFPRQHSWVSLLFQRDQTFQHIHHQGWKGSTSMASPFRCVIPHYKRYRRWGWKPGILGDDDMSTFSEQGSWLGRRCFFFRSPVLSPPHVFFFNAMGCPRHSKIPLKVWVLDVGCSVCLSCELQILSMTDPWSDVVWNSRDLTPNGHSQKPFGFQISNRFFSDMKKTSERECIRVVFMCEYLHRCF